jgi:Domain of unknown function (DUF4865)
MIDQAMIAMEYAFAFPDDFDMAAIRRRVADKGRHFDTYPGLLRKAFLARDRRADSQAEPAEAGNSYATFYLWSSAKAAADFLGGPDFTAVCAAFGRPAVRLFAPLGIADGQETAAPKAAVRSIAPLAADANLAAAIAAQRASLDALRGRPGFHSAILSLDSANWSILCFSLWATATSAEAVANGFNARYEVLHLSSPAQGLSLAEERLQTAG